MPLQTEDFTAAVRENIRAFKDSFGGTFPIERATDLIAEVSSSKGSNGDGSEGASRVGFVDVVIEGGGVKGVATLGALYALEELGFRFRKIAGTSSGALIAAFLAAAGRNAHERKVEKLLSILADLDFLTFADGGLDSQAAVKLLNTPPQNGRFREWANKSRVALASLRNLNDIINQLGFNPGGKLLVFLCNGLADLNAGEPLTVAALKRKWAFDTTRIDGKPLEQDFQVVATDISHRQKTIFPRYLNDYFHMPDEILIGDIVRASTSIPLFFAPMRLSDFSTARNNLKAAPHVMFLDGGIVSNFPLDIFDVPKNGSTAALRRPMCPTFGLLIDEQMDVSEAAEEIDNPLKLGLAMFLTAIEHGDKSYIKSSPHHDARIIHITNTVAPGRKITVIDFGMTDDDKLKLFENGVHAVLKKLAAWNFREYVHLYRSDVKRSLT